MSITTKSKIFNLFKLFLKLGITAFALYWVFANTNFEELAEKIKHSNPIYFALAILAFFISQIIASGRINTFFKAIGLNLKPLYNYKLYLLGMFYNIFLPGGIGGDGYKIFLLNKIFGIDTKKLITAKFLDKLSGVWAICFLIIIQLFFVTQLNIPNTLLISLLILGTLACFILYKFIFKSFIPAFLKAHLKALGLQLFQVLTVTFILLALGVKNSYFTYQIIFLASAFMAFLPFSIGGLGTRELVFLYGAKYLHLNTEIAVTVSLLFFVVSAICSLPGAYFVLKSSALEPETKKPSIN